MKWLGALSLAGLLALSSGCSSTGTIGGALSTPDPARSTPPRAEGVEGRVSAGRSVTDAVVYVSRIGAEVNARLPSAQAPALVEESGLAFRPRVLVVVVGTTVEFSNRDSVFHNVFSVSPVKPFDLGRYSPGKSRRVTFGTPGPVNIYCDLHPKMSAFVLVVPNRAFARPDSLGQFVLPPLPKGQYEVNVWHPDYPGVRRRVTVARGEQAEVDVTLGP